MRRFAVLTSRIKPDAIFIYYEHLPSGLWWDITLPLITPVKVAAPREVFGQRLRKIQHRADVLRLQKLIEHGGIYLDSDIVVLRDFDDLLDRTFVIAEEGPGGSHGFSNAVLLCEPGSPFARRWYDEHRTFTDEFWTQHSIQLPKRLASEHANDATVLPHTSFVWPLHYEDHLQWMLNQRDRSKPKPTHAIFGSR